MEESGFISADISKQKMAEVGIAELFSITKEWNLKKEVVLVILGNISHAQYAELLQGTPELHQSLSESELDHLSYPEITPRGYGMKVNYQPVLCIGRGESSHP